MLATGIAAAVATIRQRQADRIAELLRLAAVAQQAVLRPLGPQVGALAVAGRYISATAAADIGGDLYEALDTPYGVRIIIGDVRGKGLDAVRLASIVLGSYRHVAYERADLRAIVTDLDRAVARSVGDEDFVTAALVEERGGTLTIVNCGHPAPLLLRRGQVIALEPPAPAPPLGFMPVAQPRVERLEPGDRLLLFTDGLGEARRDGEFFPTADRAWRLLGHGTVGDGLASLETALVDWVHGQLEDDIALVLLEYAGTDGSATVPHAELGSRRRRQLARPSVASAGRRRVGSASGSVGRGGDRGHGDRARAAIGSGWRCRPDVAAWLVRLARLRNQALDRGEHGDLLGAWRRRRASSYTRSNEPLGRSIRRARRGELANDRTVVPRAHPIGGV